jgi:Xaa-Pro aminopeptidase
MKRSDEWFQVLAGALADAGATMGPAEFHGGLCGVLCAAGPEAVPAWLARWINDCGSARLAENEFRDLIETLTQDSWTALSGTDMRFAPVLPDDEEALTSACARCILVQRFRDRIGPWWPAARAGVLRRRVAEIVGISSRSAKSAPTSTPRRTARALRRRCWRSWNSCVSACKSCSRSSGAACRHAARLRFTREADGLNQKEFARRRRHLTDLVGSGGIVILPAAPERLRSRDTLFEYRPDSDLFYLTGFAEPEAAAVLVPGRAQGEFLLFCRERNPERERWDGARCGPEAAPATYACDDAFPIGDVDEILPGLLEKSERVYYPMGVAPDFDQRLLGWINALNAKRQSGHAPSEIVALGHLLHEMRLFKSRAETSAMEKSAKIAVAAHRRAMRACRPGLMEYELEAEYLHEFKRHGATCSYLPIVAGGANACVLHYRANDAELAANDLVLIDAGCEYQMYASDVTRTFPVSGRFTAAQRELYEVVLAANVAATAKVVAGNHWNDPHESAVKEITRGLRDLGILKGRLQTLLKESAYREYFMHRTGHWLGMDVHDVGDYKLAEQWRLLEPGMALTVEPGLYISRQSKAPKHWRGIGIRIEDDVVVTHEEPHVLTAGLPRTVAAIEELMAA